MSVYLDDIIVFSQTLDHHLHHLSLIINQLSKAGLKLKPSKCHFNVSQTVQHLGHLLTPEGIRPNPDQVAAVRDYPRPTSVKVVRQFLGLASYYRRFVKNFARIAQPLHSLPQKGAFFHWSPECEEAFLQLKKSHQFSCTQTLTWTSSWRQMLAPWVWAQFSHNILKMGWCIPSLMPVVLCLHRKSDMPSQSLRR